MPRQMARAFQAEATVRVGRGTGVSWGRLEQQSERVAGDKVNGGTLRTLGLAPEPQFPHLQKQEQ